MMTTGSTYAVTRPLTCYVIRPGDTAAALAQRVTGNARNRHAPWFQILSPARAAFIPKSAYDTIQSGWHVCVATDVLRRISAQPQSAPAVLLQTGITQPRTAIDLSRMWWVAPPLVIASGMVLGWFVSSRYIGDRRARVDVMRGFGATFITEFERPLFRRYVAESAIKSRLRFAPARHRLEILLAPADGRTYPNLLDHRRNVEYDVERVLRILAGAPVITGSLHAEGPWVVIPFRFETNREQEGAP
jgi:hypothetical protein